jgi:membrane protease YdiL (CAAX protease family)
MTLPTPENDPLELVPFVPPQALIPARLTVAPAWHTVVLVAGIVAISVHGAAQISALHGSINRLATYGFTAAMEAAMLAWVLFGLRLRKNSFRSLLGNFQFDLHSIAMDLGFALVFWIASLMVLGALGIAWTGVEAALTHRPAATHVAGQSGQGGQARGAFAPDPSQQQALHALAQLAPANAGEVAAWTLLCLFVGFAEEVVFRGYLQRQFIGWARGGVIAGVLFSAIVFGTAHAYQGARNMVLLAVFGVLFSVLALFRRSLRAGMFAHSWHDLIAGLALALLKSRHFI